MQHYGSLVCQFCTSAMGKKCTSQKSIPTIIPLLSALTTQLPLDYVYVLQTGIPDNHSGTTTLKTAQETEALR